MRKCVYDFGIFVCGGSFARIGRIFVSLIFLRLLIFNNLFGQSFVSYAVEFVKVNVVFGCNAAHRRFVSGLIDNFHMSVIEESVTFNVFADNFSRTETKA